MRPVEGHPVHQSARAGIVGFARNASRTGRLPTDYTYQKRISMSEQTERRRIRLVTGGILLALALVVVALRLYRIAEIPAGIQNDEAAGWRGCSPGIARRVCCFLSRKGQWSRVDSVFMR